MLDRCVENEGEPDVVQISGGEPTIHPQFWQILDAAKRRPIKHLMVNTNGIKIATDDGTFARRLKDYMPGFELYLQYDSSRPSRLRELRGEDLTSIRQKALDRLNEHNVSTTLVVTLKKGLNDEEIAFYDALAKNNSALEVMGKDNLKVIATELVTQVRKSVTIDWTLRESARAKIKVLVKRILKKHGYPPDLQEEATRLVLQQAELLCAEWAASRNELGTGLANGFHKTPPLESSLLRGVSEEAYTRKQARKPRGGGADRVRASVSRGTPAAAQAGAARNPL